MSTVKTHRHFVLPRANIGYRIISNKGKVKDFSATACKMSAKEGAKAFTVRVNDKACGIVYDLYFDNVVDAFAFTLYLKSISNIDYTFILPSGSAKVRRGTNLAEVGDCCSVVFADKKKRIVSTVVLDGSYGNRIADMFSVNDYWPTFLSKESTDGVCAKVCFDTFGYVAYKGFVTNVNCFDSGNVKYFFN